MVDIDSAPFYKVLNLHKKKILRESNRHSCGGVKRCGIDFLHGGNIYEIKRRYKKDVIDFSANINPLGLTEDIKREFIRCYELIFHYPDPDAKDLIRQIAGYRGIDEDNILIGNGSTELIYLIAYAFKPEKALIPAPTFSEYERAIATHPSPSRGEGKGGSEGQCPNNIKYFILNKDNFEINPDEFIAAMREERCDMAFLCNPNNPTGRLLKKNGVLKIAETAKELKCYLVIDEAFMDFLPNEQKHTFIWGAVKDKKFIVLRSFTKFFALPGLRIGYLVAHKDLIKRLKQIQPPWSVNSIAQYLAKIILNDKDYIEKSRKLINEEREFLFNELATLKRLKPYPSEANFLLVKIIDSRLDSSILTDELIQKGILIRDCSNFRGLNGRYFRVAVRTHKENIKLINALREVL
jgi:threonine-phosphate decarboxylase